MLFKTIVKKVTNKLPQASAIEIQDEINNFLNELSLEIEIDTETEIDLSAESNLQEIDIPDSVITVHEVYLNDTLIPGTMTWQDYKEENYTDNSVCLVSNKQKKIYFPVALDSGSDTLKLKTRINYTETTALSSSDTIAIKEHYIPAMIFYILKELYLYDKYADANKFILYDQKYRLQLAKLRDAHFQNSDIAANTLRVDKDVRHNY